MPKSVAEELADFLNNHRQKNQAPPPEWQDQGNPVQWTPEQESENQPLTQDEGAGTVTGVDSVNDAQEA